MPGELIKIDRLGGDVLRAEAGNRLEITNPGPKEGAEHWRRSVKLTNPTLLLIPSPSYPFLNDKGVEQWLKCLVSAPCVSTPTVGLLW